MIFTSDEVTRDKKSLFTVPHALFFISYTLPGMYLFIHIGIKVNSY